MACQMRSCGESHGGIHFRLHADIAVIIDMYVSASSFILRDCRADATIALGNNEAVLAAVYENEVPGLELKDHATPANMRWVPRTASSKGWGYSGQWYLDYNRHEYSLPTLPPCVLAASEMHKTKRPGRPGFTSVMLNGVPIKAAYEYTGTVLAFIGGQP